MQGGDMEIPPAPASSAQPPGISSPSTHQRPPSSVNIPSMPSLHRANRSSSRVTDGATSKLSDEESKTAVQVAVRVRPPLQATDPGFDLIPPRFRESTCEVPTPTSLSVQSQHGKKLFVFDRVFDENTTQDGIWDYLSDSVSSFVKGYNVSILAYGQSGSGKSYTMGTSGPEDQNDPHIMGVVPRAARALFEKLNGPPARQAGLQKPKRYSTQILPTMAGFAKQVNGDAPSEWELRATYVEIYNEQLRDLLVPEHVHHADRQQVAIREDNRGRILLTGMTSVPITSVGDILNALNFGSSIRQTDATNINARSSRSHAVFSLNLIQKKHEGPMSPTPKLEKRRSMPVEAMSGAENVVIVDSKLHFVDLAGSERLKNTGATGDRAKEGISINAGLASLGKVISELSSRKKTGHVSYRDSRLTRLLQDSLGGNAITFMVACVTPAAFHLSETLNTVSYAQRARAIQSKPEIQQSHEDGDKQASIDRLRAEVTFLRDQIRHSEHSERKGLQSGERSDRGRGREAELQTQVMDMQENYSALSQRHAKLISELAKARDSESADTPLLNEAIGGDAVERIRRSNSFADAVEQMVLEYEKTIQSLESSLTNTRSKLSDRDSLLLEKESRLTYMETIQQQLQARIQKAMDREHGTESYMRDLETRVEGTATGEEHSAAVIVELRRELARVRESESGAEEYISTLEERLAEAEQDQEIMQREMDRLEHVVERQRSIGRLDNLLGELDGIRQHQPKTFVDSREEQARRDMPPPPRPAKLERPKINGHRDSYDPFRPKLASEDSQANDTETEDEFTDAQTEHVEAEAAAEDEHLVQRKRASSDKTVHAPAMMIEPSNPAQSDFMADKLENLTQELFDLRSEHDANLVDYDNLQQKYQTALETLAKLEYDKEVPNSAQTPTSSSRPTSFLAGAGMKGEEKATVEHGLQGQPSSSRSLSAELSSQGAVSGTEGGVGKMEHEQSYSEKTALLEETAVHNDVAAVRERMAADDAKGGQPMHSQVALLRKLHAEKEVSVVELTNNYQSLASRHEATLAQVEDLKMEVQRARDLRPSSPGFSKPLMRRKSDDVMANDRATRAFASLRNVAMDTFESNPDQRQSFELNLNAMMTELHARSEKVYALEAELNVLKKEMETKQTIISGLTRERSSMKTASSGVDFSVVGQMRDQLMESEHQIRILHKQNAAREAELHDQIASLQASLQEHQGRGDFLPTPGDDRFAKMPGDYPRTPMQDSFPGLISVTQASPGAQHNAGRSEDVARLQRELASWETKHHSAMESMKASEAKLLNTIAELENSMRKAETEAGSAKDPGLPEAASAAGFEDERAHHRAVVDTLQRERDQYKSTATDHGSKLAQLEQAYSGIQQKVSEDSKTRDLSEKELKTHKDLVANLENQLQVHKSAITIHQETLEALQASHSKETEKLTASMAAAESQSKQRHAELEQNHGVVTQKLQANLTTAQKQVADLLRSASSALGYETEPDKLHSQIKGLVDEGKELHTRHLKTTNDLKAVQEELQNALNNTVNLESKIGELKMINEEAILNLEKVTERERKSSRLVDELEEQLNSNFDSQKATNYRLSTMQSETVQARMEIERELEDQKLRNAMLQQQIDGLKHQSLTSNASINFNRESLSPEAAAIAIARSGSASSVRKSGPPSAMPTPPPSIPLPPLPGTPGLPGITAMPAMPNGLDRTNSPFQRATSPVLSASPPGSRHTSRDVGPGMSQIVEEQEARIRTIEKHLFAEKQLTATLEEALVDLETSANRTKSDMETWRKKAAALEDELVTLRKERSNSRASLQAVEEEREMRVRAERARQALEQRMMELNDSKKNKKKGGLNCF